MWTVFLLAHLPLSLRNATSSFHYLLELVWPPVLDPVKNGMERLSFVALLKHPGGGRKSFFFPLMLRREETGDAAATEKDRETAAVTMEREEVAVASRPTSLRFLSQHTSPTRTRSDHAPTIASPSSSSSSPTSPSVHLPIADKSRSICKKHSSSKKEKDKSLLMTLVEDGRQSRGFFLFSSSSALRSSSSCVSVVAEDLKSGEDCHRSCLDPPGTMRIGLEISSDHIPRPREIAPTCPEPKPSFPRRTTRLEKQHKYCCVRARRCRLAKEIERGRTMSRSSYGSPLFATLLLRIRPGDLQGHYRNWTVGSLPVTSVFLSGTRLDPFYDSDPVPLQFPCLVHTLEPGRRKRSTRRTERMGSSSSRLTQSNVDDDFPSSSAPAATHMSDLGVVGGLSSNPSSGAGTEKHSHSSSCPSSFAPQSSQVRPVWCSLRCPSAPWPSGGRSLSQGLSSPPCRRMFSYDYPSNNSPSVDCQAVTPPSRSHQPSPRLLRRLHLASSSSPSSPGPSPSSSSGNEQHPLASERDRRQLHNWRRVGAPRRRFQRAERACPIRKENPHHPSSQMRQEEDKELNQIGSITGISPRPQTQHTQVSRKDFPSVFSQSRRDCCSPLSSSRPSLSKGGSSGPCLVDLLLLLPFSFVILLPLLRLFGIVTLFLFLFSFAFLFLCLSTAPTPAYNFRLLCNVLFLPQSNPLVSVAVPVARLLHFLLKTFLVRLSVFLARAEKPQVLACSPAPQQCRDLSPIPRRRSIYEVVSSLLASPTLYFALASSPSSFRASSRCRYLAKTPSFSYRKDEEEEKVASSSFSSSSSSFPLFLGFVGRRRYTRAFSIILFSSFLLTPPTPPIFLPFFLSSSFLPLLFASPPSHIGAASSLLGVHAAAQQQQQQATHPYLGHTPATPMSAGQMPPPSSSSPPPPPHRQVMSSLPTPGGIPQASSFSPSPPAGMRGGGGGGYEGRGGPSYAVASSPMQQLQALHQQRQYIPPPPSPSSLPPMPPSQQQNPHQHASHLVQRQKQAETASSGTSGGVSQQQLGGEEGGGYGGYSANLPVMLGMGHQGNTTPLSSGGGGLQLSPEEQRELLRVLLLQQQQLQQHQQQMSQQTSLLGGRPGGGGGESFVPFQGVTHTGGGNVGGGQQQSSAGHQVYGQFAAAAGGGGNVYSLSQQKPEPETFVRGGYIPSSPVPHALAYTTSQASSPTQSTIGNLQQQDLHTTVPSVSYLQANQNTAGQRTYSHPLYLSQSTYNYAPPTPSSQNPSSHQQQQASSQPPRYYAYSPTPPPLPSLHQQLLLPTPSSPSLPPDLPVTAAGSSVGGGGGGGPEAGPGGLPAANSHGDHRLSLLSVPAPGFEAHRASGALENPRPSSPPPAPPSLHTNFSAPPGSLSLGQETAGALSQADSLSLPQLLSLLQTGVRGEGGGDGDRKPGEGPGTGGSPMFLNTVVKAVLDDLAAGRTGTVERLAEILLQPLPENQKQQIYSVLLQRLSEKASPGLSTDTGNPPFSFSSSGVLAGASVSPLTASSPYSGQSRSFPTTASSPPADTAERRGGGREGEEGRGRGGRGRGEEEEQQEYLQRHHLHEGGGAGGGRLKVLGSGVEDTSSAIGLSSLPSSFPPPSPGSYSPEKNSFSSSVSDLSDRVARCLALPSCQGAGGGGQAGPREKEREQGNENSYQRQVSSEDRLQSDQRQEGEDLSELFPSVWDPRCASDGNTYANACVFDVEACVRAVTGQPPLIQVHEGSCQVSTSPTSSASSSPPPPPAAESNTKARGGGEERGRGSDSRDGGQPELQVVSAYKTSSTAGDPKKDKASPQQIATHSQDTARPGGAGGAGGTGASSSRNTNTADNRVKPGSQENGQELKGSRAQVKDKQSNSLSLGRDGSPVTSAPPQGGSVDTREELRGNDGGKGKSPGEVRKPKTADQLSDSRSSSSLPLPPLSPASPTSPPSPSAASLQSSADQGARKISGLDSSEKLSLSPRSASLSSSVQRLGQTSEGKEEDTNTRKNKDGRTSRSSQSSNLDEPYRMREKGERTNATAAQSVERGKETSDTSLAGSTEQEEKLFTKTKKETSAEAGGGGALSTSTASQVNPSSPSLAKLKNVLPLLPSFSSSMPLPSSSDQTRATTTAPTIEARGSAVLAEERGDDQRRGVLDSVSLLQNNGGSSLRARDEGEKKKSGEKEATRHESAAGGSNQLSSRSASPLKQESVGQALVNRFAALMKGDRLPGDGAAVELAVAEAEKASAERERKKREKEERLERRKKREEERQKRDQAGEGEEDPLLADEDDEEDADEEETEDMLEQDEDGGAAEEKLEKLKKEMASTPQRASIEKLMKKREAVQHLQELQELQLQLLQQQRGGGGGGTAQEVQGASPAGRPLVPLPPDSVQGRLPIHPTSLSPALPETSPGSLPTDPRSFLWSAYNVTSVQQLMEERTKVKINELLLSRPQGGPQGVESGGGRGKAEESSRLSSSSSFPSPLSRDQASLSPVNASPIQSFEAPASMYTAFDPSGRGGGAYNTLEGQGGGSVATGRTGGLVESHNIHQSAPHPSLSSPNSSAPGPHTASYQPLQYPQPRQEDPYRSPGASPQHSPSASAPQPFLSESSAYSHSSIQPPGTANSSKGSFDSPSNAALAPSSPSAGSFPNPPPGTLLLPPPQSAMARPFPQGGGQPAGETLHPHHQQQQQQRQAQPPSSSSSYHAPLSPAVMPLGNLQQELYPTRNYQQNLPYNHPPGLLPSVTTPSPASPASVSSPSPSGSSAGPFLYGQQHQGSQGTSSNPSYSLSPSPSPPLPPPPPPQRMSLPYQQHLSPSSPPSPALSSPHHQPSAGFNPAQYYQYSSQQPPSPQSSSVLPRADPHSKYPPSFSSSSSLPPSSASGYARTPSPPPPPFVHGGGATTPPYPYSSGSNSNSTPSSSNSSGQLLFPAPTATIPGHSSPAFPTALSTPSSLAVSGQQQHQRGGTEEHASSRTRAQTGRESDAAKSSGTKMKTNEPPAGDKNTDNNKTAKQSRASASAPSSPSSPFSPPPQCNFLCPAGGPVVCGTDGQTYSNECEARVYACLKRDPSLSVRHRGPCKRTNGGHNRNQLRNASTSSSSASEGRSESVELSHEEHQDENEEEGGGEEQEGGEGKRKKKNRGKKKEKAAKESWEEDEVGEAKEQEKEEEGTGDGEDGDEKTNKGKIKKIKKILEEKNDHAKGAKKEEKEDKTDNLESASGQKGTGDDKTEKKKTSSNPSKMSFSSRNSSSQEASTGAPGTATAAAAASPDDASLSAWRNERKGTSLTNTEEERGTRGGGGERGGRGFVLTLDDHDESTVPERSSLKAKERKEEEERHQQPQSEDGDAKTPSISLTLEGITQTIPKYRHITDQEQKLQEEEEEEENETFLRSHHSKRSPPLFLSPSPSSSSRDPPAVLSKGGERKKKREGEEDEEDLFPASPAAQENTKSFLEPTAAATRGGAGLGLGLRKKITAKEGEEDQVREDGEFKSPEKHSKAERSRAGGALSLIGLPAPAAATEEEQNELQQKTADDHAGKESKQSTAIRRRDTPPSVASTNLPADTSPVQRGGGSDRAREETPSEERKVREEEEEKEKNDEEGRKREDKNKRRPNGKNDVNYLEDLARLREMIDSDDFGEEEPEALEEEEEEVDDGVINDAPYIYDGSEIAKDDFGTSSTPTGSSHVEYLSEEELLKKKNRGEEKRTDSTPSSALLSSSSSSSLPSPSQDPSPTGNAQREHTPSSSFSASPPTLSGMGLGSRYAFESDSGPNNKSPGSPSSSSSAPPPSFLDFFKGWF